MKFTDGNWLVQPGARVHYATEIHDVIVDEGGLTIYAPTRRIEHRGDTLQGPLLTIRVESPLADVIRVKLAHFAGAVERGPRIPLATVKAPQIEITEDKNGATLRTGKLSA